MSLKTKCCDLPPLRIYYFYESLSGLALAVLNGSRLKLNLNSIFGKRGWLLEAREERIRKNTASELCSQRSS